jgi:phage shock protein A
MGIFSRFTDIVKSNINSILEKAEDPEKMVRLMIQEMEDTLVEVRSAAARAIADKKEIARRLERVSAEVDDWQDKAELAVSKGRDDLARAALAEKARVGQVASTLDADHTALEEGLNKLNGDIARLEEKLADAKSRQKALIARHSTAQRRLDVRKQIHDYRIDDALLRFEQFESRMDDVEGRVEAYDLGLQKDLASQFHGLESDEAVSQELERLKQRLSAKPAAPRPASASDEAKGAE